MKYIPKITETNTKKNDPTIARRRYLRLQIALLRAQKRRCESLELQDPTSLFEQISKVNFIATLNVLIEDFSLELFKLMDIFDEHNS